MLSKRYVPTNIESLNYEENLVKHYRKLEEIQKEDRKKKNVDKEVAEKAKFTESREKAIKFHISERTNAIEKDNELLLGRLVEISRKKPGVLAQVKSENSLPRTLNGPSRRREKNRIAAENEAFARRLLSQQPSFNPKKLEQDYEKHHVRVKNMAKLSHFSPRKVRLPPIKYADYDNTKDNKDNKKTVKIAKKENKKKNDDEVENQPSSVSPVKTKAKDDAPAKSLATTDNNTAKNDGVKDSNVDKHVSDKTSKDNVSQNDLNKPAENQNQNQNQSVAPSNANVDNKSQVLPDAQPKSAVDNGEKTTNNAISSSAVDNKLDDTKPAETKPVETNPAEIKPVEEPVPKEEIPHETKPAETKPAETKPVEEPVPKEEIPHETKPAETKSVESVKEEIPDETK